MVSIFRIVAIWLLRAIFYLNKPKRFGVFVLELEVGLGEVENWDEAH
jgi:hypothetical protein